MRFSFEPSQRPAGSLALPVATAFGFALAFLAVVVVAIASWRSLGERTVAVQRMSRSQQAISAALAVLSTLKDAETGERGYLITGAERYLEPYSAAHGDLAAALARLRETNEGDAREKSEVEALAVVADQRMKALAEAVALRRAGNSEEAVAAVASDRGKALMDRARRSVNEIVRSEEAALATRQTEWQEAVQWSALVANGGSAVLLFLIVAAALASSRDFRLQQRQAWVRSGHVGVAKVLADDQDLEAQGDRVLAFLAAYLHAPVGAFYVADGAGALRRTGGYALADDVGDAGPGSDSPQLVAQAARDRRMLHVTDVPEGYLRVSSALGSAPARELLLAPALADGAVHAVIELGFLRPVEDTDRELLERVGETVAMAIRAAKDRARLQELLEETQRQSEELQAQQEELRVGNEELEEQGRALRESQAMLESQQTELEQTNAQLESHSEMLARRNEALAGAQAALDERAAELERSNQVKSEFLANMSHELRTPLNSTLILAKLLADNKDGNLSDEQVKFAETISSAGNDLLTLINDILDFAKLEAGKVEVAVESVPLERVLEPLRLTFGPIAAEKKLAFSVLVEPGAPADIETDPQRLGQILRNLIANALKFTDSGEVALRVFAGDGGLVSFAVRDTGVGIAREQQEVIFEAFRQADGSTHRKYGGTGLGLAISRDLAKLLGGELAVQSEVGSGSVFTLALPRAWSAATPSPAADHARGRPAVVPSAAKEPAPAARAAGGPSRRGEIRRSAQDDKGEPVGAASRSDDDRAVLKSGSRLILVVEDDARFAAILRDLAHEMGFQCIVAASAGEGVEAARTYRPSAIVLDMNLPDHSGLGVLDQLKRDPQTRHIPVHVASVADYRREARELGAIGYAMKPVKREELVQALKALDAMSSQHLRNVLVVEDDPRQLEAIAELLGGDGVRITGVASGAEALAALQATTFDCMVMDLVLPDLSGHELLEKMAARDDVSFPPVIVYTGRALGRDEEQRLRRHSRSIIVKDARSPERLLDEVTLFLHQVESELAPERQRMLREARSRDALLEGRRILVVEDDVRNIFALTSVLEPKGAHVVIARNGREALDAIEASGAPNAEPIDLVLMDIMMPEMDGYTAMREIRKRPAWQKLPIIALTAKAMKDDQEKCIAAGANDYIAKPLDVEKLLSLVRVWMPR